MNLAVGSVYVLLHGPAVTAITRMAEEKTTGRGCLTVGGGITLEAGRQGFKGGGVIQP